MDNSIINQGLVKSANSKIGFHLSLNNIYGDGDDIVITAVRLVFALAPNATSTATTTLKLPKTIEPNTYNLCAQADSADTVTEMDENNNVLCSATQITVPPPDLLMTSLNTATTVLQPSQNLRISNTVVNQGGSKAPAFTIAFHLSSNATYGDADDINIDTTRSIPNLNIGTSKPALTKLVIPTTTPLGDYYICAKADNENSVDEGAFENNNSTCTDTPISVTAPDLSVTAVTPSVTTVNQGATVAVSNTVINDGAVKSPSSVVGFRLSLNNVYGDDDDIIITATRSAPGLIAGASNTKTTKLTVPANTAPNSYYLCAEADTAGTVLETDEGNNATCSSMQLTVPSPGVAVSTLTTTSMTESGT